MISKFLSQLNKEELKSYENINNDQKEELKKFESIIKVLVDEIKDIIDLHEKLNNKVKNIEESIKKIKAQIDQLNSDFNNEKEKKTEFNDRLKNIESQMQKFVSLYELIINQYSPFIKQDSEKNEIKQNEYNIPTGVEKNQNKVVIEDSISGESSEIDVNEAKFKYVDIPKGNKLPSDLVKRELMYLRYNDNIGELKNVINEDEKKLKEHLKGFQIPDKKVDVLTLKGVVENLPGDVEKAKQKVFNVIKDYPKLEQKIKNAKNLDELRQILVQETINQYISQKENL